MLLLHQTPTPPTQSEPRPVLVSPGVSVSRLLRLRAVGRSRMVSPANVATWRAFWTSTVGASPTTVTVSERTPTAMVALTGAVNPVVNTTLSRCCFENPSSVNVTV